jgi:hypothetical protein
MNANTKGFNIIFYSQGSGLKIFNNLLPSLDKELHLNKVGIYVADQFFFSRYTSKDNNFSKFNTRWLKEWDINKVASHTKPDNSLIERFEQTYGIPDLWSALNCDRRIMLGQYTKYTQDYSPRYSHQQMLSFLQVSISKIEDFIDTVQPQAIIGFNMVTLGEYLFYLIAKQKNIPYWQIKNAKIDNLVTLFPDPLAASSYIQENPLNDDSSDAFSKAKSYLLQAQKKDSTYEGHIILKPPSGRNIFGPALIKKLAAATAFSLIKKSQYPYDSQSAGLKAVWYFNVNRPLKSINHHKFLSRYYISPSKLADTKYVFFPLHTEPEIALSVYGRWYQNQIEVIRNIAQSIPVTWKVVVKDHPRSLGIRKLQYYKKLLEIPNVRLVNPYLPSYDVIENAKAVITISGWVGFEAVMSKKPVVTLGECAYNALPDSMVRKNKSYCNLALDIQRAIDDYKYDERVLLDHIASIIHMSHPINMYSEVLAKPNRHSTVISDDQRRLTWQLFAAHIAKTIKSRQG